MFNYIAQYLKLPDKEDNDEYLTARLLHICMLVLLGWGILIPLILWAIGLGHRLVLFLIFGIGDTILVGLIYGLQRGHTRLVRYALPVLLWATFTVPVYLFEGIYDSAVSGFFIVIIMASLILNSRAVFIFALISIVAITGAFFADEAGALSVYVRKPPNPVDLIILISTLGASALLLRMTTQRLAHAYLQVRKNEQALQQANDKLESKIIERTRRLHQTNNYLRRELAERGRVEMALRESEEKYRQLFEFAPAGIYEVDLSSGKLISVNDVICEYLGYTRAELLSMTPFEFLFDSERAQFAERLGKVRSGERVADTIEYRVRSKDGQAYWSLLNVRVMFENDNPARLAVVAHDITERKQTEEALRESEEKYRALTENSIDIIMRFDRQYRHLYVNPAVSSVLPGLAPNDFIGKTHTEMGFPEALCHYWETMIRKVFDTGEVQVDTFELPQENGRTVIFWQLVPEFDPAGNVETVLTTSRDITHQREAAEALQQAHAELELKVKERTAELVAANEQLAQEILEREQIDEALCLYSERLEILRKIELTILEARSSEAIAKIAVSHIVGAIPCQWASVVLFDFEAEQGIELAAQFSGEREITGSKTMPLSAFALNPAMRAGRAVIIEDTRTQSDVTPVIQELRTAGLRACIGIPLVTQSQLIGALYLGACASGTFNDKLY